MEFIQELQDKIEVENERSKAKENKLQRESALNKRKMNEAIRQVDHLNKQIKVLKQNSVVADKKKVKLTRPVTSNPYKESRSGFSGVRINTQSK